jgi:hypothetical protein
MKQFLASKSICVIQHPHYPPGFRPAEIFHFPTVKLALKGGRVSDISDIQRGLTEQLKGFLCRTFSALSRTCINDLSIVWRWGVEYVEIL